MTLQHAGQGSGGLLATNTVGAILGSLLVPFLFIPLLGSPLLVAGLALVNAVVGTLLGWRWVPKPSGGWIAATGAVVAIVIVVTAARPGVIVQPNVAYITGAGGQVFASKEDEIASVQAGQISFTPGAVGRRDLDDPADRRREAHADPAAHRQAGARRAP